MDYNIQRVDVQIRSEFPELVTVIYKISRDRYSIFIKNSDNPLNENNSAYQKILAYLSNGKIPCWHSYDIKCLDNYQYFTQSSKDREIIHKLKTSQFSKINSIALNNLVHNHQFIQNTSNYFSFYLKPIHINVDIIEKEPTQYIKILPPINDTNIVSDFKGILLSKIWLKSLLVSNFRRLNIGEIKDNKHNEIIIEIDSDAFKKLKQPLYKFLNNLFRGYKLKLIDLGDEYTEPELELVDNNLYHRPVSNLYSPRLFNSPEFEQRDEALYFDNLENIYQGVYNKSSLEFYPSKNDQVCFLDYSWIYQNPINIRNYLLWYDKLFITLPMSIDSGDKTLEHKYNTVLRVFKGEHKIDSEEIFELIRTNRVFFILDQPNYRYDIDFLKEIYQLNPKAIVSRRATNMLLLMDIVEIYRNYKLKDIIPLDKIPDLTQTLARDHNLPQQYLYDFFMWPIRAYRKSLEVFTFSTSQHVSTLGINNVLQPYASTVFDKSMDLEYIMTSTNTHISNALNATYFSGSRHIFEDDYYALTMGSILNLYKELDRDVKEQNSDQGVNIFLPNQNPIEFFDVDSYSSVKEVNDIYKTFNTARNGKSLISELALLNPAERQYSINNYNNQILNINKNKKDLRWAWDIGSNILSIPFGAQFPNFDPLLLTAITLAINYSINETLTSPFMQKYLSQLIQKFYGNNYTLKHAHFLNNISRVAKFKKVY